MQILDDTVLSERYDQDEIDATVGVPLGWVDKPHAMKVYIDDLNIVEKVKQSTAISSITENVTTLLPHAIKSERNFNLIKTEIRRSRNEGEQ